MQPAGVSIRKWEPEDFVRLAVLAGRLSPTTLRLRFLGGLHAVPVSYLSGIERRWHSTWDSVAALDGGDLIGWAELGWRAEHPLRADVAVCVLDEEQGHGIGTALLTAVIGRARALGVEQLHADMAPDNVIVRRMWRTVTGGPGTTADLRRVTELVA